MSERETGQGVLDSISRADDSLTLIAIGILAYVCGDMLHEVAGHGAVCIATGGKALLLSTVNFECSEQGRWMAAAGTLANLSAGTVSWMLLRWLRSASTHLRYFLWLSLAFNLLNVGGYLAYSGATNTGDLAFVISELRPAWIWRTTLVSLGLILYYLCMWIVAIEMRPFLGPDLLAELRRARRLTLVPYLAAGISACVAALFNPIGLVFVATAAGASSFGSGFGLIWAPRLLQHSWKATAIPDAPVRLTRNVGWIVTAAVLFVIFAGLIGPGIRFTGKT